MNKKAILAHIQKRIEFLEKFQMNDEKYEKRLSSGDDEVDIGFDDGNIQGQLSAFREIYDLLESDFL